MINLLEVFGVEECEVFEIFTGGKSWVKYAIIENSLNHVLDNGDFRYSKFEINTIANAEIRRLPFVPKVGEIYHTVKSVDGYFYLIHSYNHYSGWDVSRLELGLCYRTKEQAEREGIPKLKALIEKWGGKVE